ncbi:N-acetyltransferase [Rhizocola hellebori]|uniref:N-acetyltransferase n=1 Tax=Rhizocola hellebori TaxID=1392758 RepID=A0A8J3QEB9_9ACTN|nr:GNAT family N-acetyltransferase [Rhizocola hellebori]GIH09303.1 N-acetyltransferase [Rhizocola hellebori]
MLIREATIDDVPAFDRIRQAAFSWHVATVVAQRNWFTSSPPEARSLRLAAQVDGAVVGFAMGGLYVTTKEPGVGSVTCVVHPDFRRRGIGGALYAQIEEHLGTLDLRRAQSYAAGDPEVIAWAEGRGWTQGATGRFSAVDTSNLPPMPQTPGDTTVVSISALAPEEAYDLDKTASADEPGDVSYDGLSYDMWLKRIWRDPDLRHDISQVALVDGVPASMTLVSANLETGRCWSGGTMTLPAYRGRGLAKLLKSVALRKAAEAGVTTAITSNDYTNAPMLAINDWLGYRPTVSEVSMLKNFADAKN